MSWMKNLTFKQRIFLSLVVFTLYGGLIHLHEWHPHTFQCFQYFNRTHAELSLQPTIKEYSEFVKTDDFANLTHFLHFPRDPRNPAPYEKVIRHTIKLLKNPTLGDVTNYKPNWNESNYEKFQHSISRNRVYQDNDPVVAGLLFDMSTLPIQFINTTITSRQMKLTVTFSNGAQALFKPKRMTRETTVQPDHFFFQDIERHNSEIAAYHLDRALGFGHVLPVVGRRLNLTTEFNNHTSAYLDKLFFWSQANNYCFWTNGSGCSFYCDIFDPICGDGDLLEGSMATYLPQFEGGEIMREEYPWRRIVSFLNKGFWEFDSAYCDGVRNKTLYSDNDSRRLLDMVDLSIFDFIAGIMDRQRYEYFSAWHNDSTLVYLDNARGFGRPFTDDLLILAPLVQCCIIRDTTLQTLLIYHNGPTRLSEKVRELLQDDPIAPILWEPHYPAMDRRVQIILEEVENCIQKVEN